MVASSRVGNSWRLGVEPGKGRIWETTSAREQCHRVHPLKPPFALGELDSLLEISRDQQAPPGGWQSYPCPI